MAIKINTAAVRSTANQISTVNTKISNDFSSVQSAINSLNSNWDGSASDAAIRKFNNIKTTYFDKKRFLNTF